MADLFDVLAPFYERLIPPPDPQVLQTLLALKPEHTLLDAAGGTGRVATVFSSGLARTVVCDASSRMLAQARRKGLETVLTEVETLPFADATFDRVLLVDAFHHVRDQATALRELLRVLKPDGKLVIEEPDIRRWQVKIVALMEKAACMRSCFVSLDRMLAQITRCGGHARLEHTDRFRIWLSVTSSEPSNRSDTPADGEISG